MKKLFLSLVFLIFSVQQSYADGITRQVPSNIQCYLNGTGQGKCRIYFPEDFSVCQHKNVIGFDPENGVLGKQVYSMVLAAISANKELEVSFIDSSCPLSSAYIDWIKYL